MYVLCVIVCGKKGNARYERAHTHAYRHTDTHRRATAYLMTYGEDLGVDLVVRHEREDLHAAALKV